MEKIDWLSHFKFLFNTTEIDDDFLDGERRRDRELYHLRLEQIARKLFKEVEKPSTH